MALDRRKMQFTNGVVLTQAQWEELRKKQPQYKVGPTTLAMLLAMTASFKLPRR